MDVKRIRWCYGRTDTSSRPHLMQVIMMASLIASIKQPGNSWKESPQQDGVDLISLPVDLCKGIVLTLFTSVRTLG